jgi:hypothetical protein
MDLSPDKPSPRLGGGAGWFYVKFGLPAKPVSTLAEGEKSSMFVILELSGGEWRKF